MCCLAICRSHAIAQIKLLHNFKINISYCRPVPPDGEHKLSDPAVGELLLKCDLSIRSNNYYVLHNVQAGEAIARLGPFLGADVDAILPLLQQGLHLLQGNLFEVGSEPDM